MSPTWWRVPLASWRSLASGWRPGVSAGAGDQICCLGPQRCTDSLGGWTPWLHREAGPHPWWAESKTNSSILKACKTYSSILKAKLTVPYCFSLVSFFLNFIIYSFIKEFRIISLKNIVVLPSCSKSVEFSDNGK